MFAVRSAANSLNALWRWSVDSDDKQWNRLSLPDAKIPIPRDAQTDGFLFGRGHIFASREQVAGNVQETSGWVLVFPYLRTQRTKIASSLVLRRSEKGGWEFGMLVTRAPFWQSAKCMANFALDNQITYLMPFMALLLACENAGTLLAAPKFISTQAIPNLFK
jgi:hypothetical protein